MVVKARKAGAKEQNERSDGKSRRGREGKSAQLHGKNSAIIRHKLGHTSTPTAPTPAPPEPPLRLLRALFICALGRTPDLLSVISRSPSLSPDRKAWGWQLDRCDVLQSECVDKNTIHSY